MIEPGAAGGVLALVLAVNLALRRAVALRGGTLDGARAYAWEFMLWTLLALQKVAQAARSVSLAGLPDYMRAIFDYLLVLQLESKGALRIDCLHGVQPFITEAISLAAGLTLFLLFVLVLALREWAPVARLLGRGCCCRCFRWERRERSQGRAQQRCFFFVLLAVVRRGRGHQRCGRSRTRSSVSGRSAKLRA